jgi:hypothetical protein
MDFQRNYLLINTGNHKKVTPLLLLKYVKYVFWQCHEQIFSERMKVKKLKSNQLDLLQCQPFFF